MCGALKWLMLAWTMCVLVTPCRAGRILVLPTPLAQSHQMGMQVMATELSQRRGHQVMVSLSRCTAHRLRTGKALMTQSRLIAGGRARVQCLTSSLCTPGFSHSNWCYVLLHVCHQAFCLADYDMLLAHAVWLIRSMWHAVFGDARGSFIPCCTSHGVLWY